MLRTERILYLPHRRVRSEFADVYAVRLTKPLAKLTGSNTGLTQIHAERGARRRLP